MLVVQTYVVTLKMQNILKRVVATRHYKNIIHQQLQSLTSFEIEIDFIFH